MNQRASSPLGRAVLMTLLVIATTTSSTQAEDSNLGSAVASTPMAPTAPLMPGQRLRVTAASPAFTGVTVGILREVGPDTLTMIDPTRGAVKLPLNSITRVEVSHPRRGTRKGLHIGLGVGAALSIPLLVDDAGCWDDSFETLSSCTVGEKAGVSAFLIGLSAGAGAWLGHRKQSDEWSEAPRQAWMRSPGDPARQVGPTRSSQGPGVGATAASSDPAGEKRTDGEGIGSSIAARAALAVGQRLRVTTVSPAFTGSTVGVLLKMESDSLTLGDPKGGALTVLPLDSITRVEVSHRRNAAKSGLLIGALLGVGAVGIGGGACSVDLPCSDRELNLATAGMAAFTGGIGAWLGSRKHSDHWSDAPIRDDKQPAGDLKWQVSPILTQGAKGGGLRLRLTW